MNAKTNHCHYCELMCQGMKLSMHEQLTVASYDRLMLNYCSCSRQMLRQRLWMTPSSQKTQNLQKSYHKMTVQILTAKRVQKSKTVCHYKFNNNEI